MLYPFYFDDTYILILAAAAFSMWSSWRVNSTYNEYYKVQSRTGVTAAEAARLILENNGIYDVQVIHIAGNLTDHYNPGKNAHVP